jgi:hypothetical protein
MVQGTPITAAAGTDLGHRVADRATEAGFTNAPATLLTRALTRTTGCARGRRGGSPTVVGQNDRDQPTAIGRAGSKPRGDLEYFWDLPKSRQQSFAVRRLSAVDMS